MNVFLVKFGSKYSSSDVNVLAQALADVGDVYCYTDDPYGVDAKTVEPIRRLKGVWNKLAMFSSQFPIQGPSLYVDLDTIVNFSPVTLLRQYDIQSKLWLIHNPSKQGIVNQSNYDVIINSSVMLFDNRKPEIQEIWDHFVDSGLTDYFLRKYVGIDRYLVHEQFDTVPHDLSRSWKYDQVKDDRPFTTFEECHSEFILARSRAN